MLSSERISTLEEPLKKKRRTRSYPSKFQGKWHTNLGTLYINGSRGYYGDSLTNWMLANKFLTNITATADGNTLRGKWLWTLNDRVFGKFEFTLVPGHRSFSGTWGWNRRWKGGGYWNGSRFQSISLVENPGMNVKPVKDHASKALENGDNAALEYVRLMTSKVGYTFTPPAICEPGGGIKPNIKDPLVENLVNEQVLFPSANDTSNKPSQLLEQSTQAIPKNPKEKNDDIPEPSFQEVEEQIAANSPEDNSAISATALPTVASEPEFEPSEVSKNTTEEADIEPQQNLSANEVVEYQIQTELSTITGDRCRSNDPALDPELNEKKIVELSNGTEHLALPKSIPQENKIKENLVVTNDEDTEDMEDLPDLSMCKMISLFSMP